VTKLQDRRPCHS